MFWLYLLVFAFIGAALRFFISTRLNADFPYGTLLVNILGSLFIGFLFANTSSGSLKLALAVGLLGALTTYSSYSIESVMMIEKGRWALLATYVLSTNLLAIGFCWLGYRFAPAFLKSL